MKLNIQKTIITTLFFILFFSTLQIFAAPLPNEDLEKRAVILPPVPPAPRDPPKPAGDGAGAYASKKPTLLDRLQHKTYRAMVSAADGLGLDNAARDLDHYLDNIGTDLTISPDQIMSDIPEFKEAVRALAETYAKRAFKNSKKSLTGSMFQSPWTSFYATKALSKDWFFALGGFSYSVAGSVNVRKVNGKYTTELKWRVYIFDRYNWDTGKGVTIGPFTFTDEELGRMHLVGLAKEYVVRGQSTFRVEKWTGGKLSAPNLRLADYEFNG